MGFHLTRNFWQQLSTYRLGDELGDAGIVSLLKLLTWTAENRVDGELSGLDETDIELVAGWGGERGKFVETAAEMRCLQHWDDNGVERYAINGWKVIQRG